MSRFDEIRFPEDISYGAIGGPQYSTNIVLTSSGNEYRNINYSSSRMKFNVAYGVKTKEQMDKLLFFLEQEEDELSVLNTKIGLILVLKIN
jgi:uncharacterized protein (TIGR02217 family)